MDTPDRFDKIYEVYGIPITLFEIEEWWENTGLESKTKFSTPDNGDAARYAIAAQIVKEMSQTTANEKMEILKKFRKEHQRQKESFGIDIGKIRNRRNRLGHDPDFKRISNDDLSEMSWGEFSGIPRSPSPTISTYRRPPDLPNIVSNDPVGHMGSSSIFQQAMRMAEEKLRKEEEFKRQQKFKYQENEYVKQQQKQRYYEKTQVNVEIENKKSWKEILGFSKNDDITKEQMIKSFRNKAMLLHPDKGGSEQDMSDLIDARNQALKEFD